MSAYSNLVDSAHLRSTAHHHQLIFLPNHFFDRWLAFE